MDRNRSNQVIFGAALAVYGSTILGGETNLPILTKKPQSPSHNRSDSPVNCKAGLRIACFLVMALVSACLAQAAEDDEVVIGPISNNPQNEIQQQFGVVDFDQYVFNSLGGEKQ